MAAEKVEVVEEIDALQAVYGDDCLVLDSYPPHLHVLIKPRTADVTSQQFVEAVIRIQASSQYPKEPPLIDVLDSKGLDGKRKKHLATCMREKACELSSCLMLVALCEEAVEKLSSMNHPDGNCPLCLYPLVPQNEDNKILPFMKLMSCFHCFHSECIIRWWNWLQTETEANSSNLSGLTASQSSGIRNKKDTHGELEERMGNCPVCRKVFHVKDFKHVLDLVSTHSSQLSLDKDGSSQADLDENILLSDSEINRRQKFEAILEIQKENSGLIEPKRNLTIVPGMFLPQPVRTSISCKNPSDEYKGNTSEAQPSGSSNRLSTNRQRNSGMRRHKTHNSKQPVKQWIRKESSNQ